MISPINHRVYTELRRDDVFAELAVYQKKFGPKIITAEIFHNGFYYLSYVWVLDL